MIEVMRALLLVLCLAWSTPGLAAPRPSARDPEAGAVALLQDIDARGANAVLMEVYEDEPRWERLLAGVASGTAGWLKVAERLKRVAREQSEELTVALGRALEREAANALSVLGEAFDADDVCSLNTLEQSLGRDYAAALRSVERRERAVARVSDPALRTQRDECLAFLGELKREVVRNRKTWFGS
jgi:hypothetical protein